ncbi:MAG: sulfotransferase domain-containing protein [Anaerolineales bacterium]|nr:sulfotransferase domain-containing protein [Anaerolineales bacterium]
MIILSVGMPRAGSGWYYNLTHDLVTATGGQDARQIRQRYHLESILTEVNCNIGALTPRRLVAISIPALTGNTFSIKAHAGPTPTALKLIQRGLIHPTYIYRDPRDAMLSAMDNGQRAREKGRSNAFSHLVDFETAVDFMLDYLRIWEAWMACELALHVRYENLLTGYEFEAERLLEFLKIETQDSAVQDVIDKYRPRQAQPGQKGLHFSKGKIGRFRQRMTIEQQDFMVEKFGTYLEHMGYPI